MNYTLPSSLSTHAASCGCPACADLSCLERPRFFAGQLLTEAELNGEQAWVIAKNRLHNRYLHGPGVVCGLQVVCGDCDGHVTVRSGYAIDPCGNDIVVCADTDFNVIQAIEDCCTASRSRRSDCDPYAKLWAERCTDVEETWCISIRYEETEARPTTALPVRTTGGRYRCTSAGCGCRGCGGAKGASSASSSKASGGCTGACGCGGGGGTTAAAPASSTQPAACQPTRILEGFRLGLACEPDTGTYQTSKDGLAGVLGTLAPPGSLLRRLIDCALDAWTVASKTVTKTDLFVLVAIAENKYFASPALQYTAACHLRQAVIALYANGGCNVRCEAAQLLAATTIAAPGAQDTSASYGQSVQPAVQTLAMLGLQYLIDCWCCAFLPSCDTGATDDRLLLACVTVKDGRVLRICNLGPRQFAGSFPSMWYWLSIVPLVPMLRAVLEGLCCEPFSWPGGESLGSVTKDTGWSHGFPKPSAMAPGAGTGAVPTPSPSPSPSPAPVPMPTGLTQTSAGAWFTLLAGDGFAVPRDLLQRAERLLVKLPASGLLAGLVDRNAVDVRPLLGGDPAQVEAALANSGAHPVVREVTGDELERVRGVALGSPVVLRGDAVVIYRSGDRIVGFAAADSVKGAAPAPAAASAAAVVDHATDATTQIAALRAELHQLRGEVSRLRHR
jgi:hypothetical protein